MGSTDYERLSALDVSFLAFEDANVHMHVAAIVTFDAAPLTNDSGRLDFDAIRSVVENSLPAIPRFRQKLGKIPLFDYPVWADDERFNIDYHVRHTALPPPGDERRLKRLTGRILSQKLDRGKPLWEIWVVEGLEGGRFALIIKAHHCMVDGVAGLDVLTAILRFEPETQRTSTDTWTPRPPTSGTRLVVDEVKRRTSAPLELVKQGRRLLDDPRKLATDAASTMRGIRAFARAAMDQAGESRLNQDVGPFRRFDWTTTPLQDVSVVRKQFGGTINDVALATAAGAIGEYLRGHDEAIDNESFHVQFPVNTRTAADGKTGNKVAMLLAPLPIAERDPVERLQLVTAMTDEVKHSGQTEGLDAVGRMSDLMFPELTSFFGRIGVKQRSFNVVVTNVPGPRDPVYLLESEMQDMYPLVPLLANQTLGIALFSYYGKLQWGFHADWDAVPDLHDLVEGIDRHFSALLERAQTA